MDFIARRDVADDEVNTVSSMMCSSDWCDDPEVTRKLFDLYVEAGFIDLNQRLPGALQPPGAQGKRPGPIDGGKLPLAAAISARSRHAVRACLDHGASLELGAVHLGSRPRHALEFAAEVGAEVHAVVVESMRRQRGDDVASPVVAEASTPPRRRVTA